MRYKKIMAVSMAVALSTTSAVGTVPGQIIDVSKIYAATTAPAVGNKYVYLVEDCGIEYKITLSCEAVTKVATISTVAIPILKIDSVVANTDKTDISFQSGEQARVEEKLNQAINNNLPDASGNVNFSTKVGIKKSGAYVEFNCKSLLSGMTTGTGFANIKNVTLTSNAIESTAVWKAIFTNVSDCIVIDAENVTIGANTFGATKVKSLFTNKAVTISSDAFKANKFLEITEFRSDVKFSGGNAFDDCTNLKFASFIGNVTFNGEKKNYTNCKNTTYTFLGTVTNGFQQFAKETIYKVQFSGTNKTYKEVFKESNIDEVLVENPGNVLSTNTFKDCKIKTMTIGPAANGTDIGSNAINGGSITNLMVNAKSAFFSQGINAAKITSMEMNAECYFSLEGIAGKSELEAFTSRANLFIKRVKDDVKGKELPGMGECTIGNMDLSGKTVIENGAISNLTCKVFSINKDAELGAEMLLGCKIDEMYFNRNIDGKEIVAKGEIGDANTKITDLHFNYANYDKSVVDEVKELKGLSFSKVTCTNVYFHNPNLRAISSSSLNPNASTTIYYYGGANSRDENNNLISGEQLIKKWTGNSDKCKYVNVVGDIEVKPVSGANNQNYKVYTTNGKAVVDFSAGKLFTVTQTINKENNTQLYGDEKGTITNTMEMVAGEASVTSTNDGYRVLKPISDSAKLSDTYYNYQDKDGKWYTALTGKSDMITKEGVYTYLIEAGGRIFPITLEIHEKPIVSISVKPATGSTFVAAVGAKASADLFSVYALYEGETKEIQLAAGAYDIKDTTIKKGMNEVTISVVKYKGSTEALTSVVGVIGYDLEVDKIVAKPKKDTMYEGATLTLADVVLQQVTYKNLPIEEKDITAGFSFYVNGRETNSVTIVKGENRIGISYKGKKLDNVLVIQGKECNIVRVEAKYVGGDVYEYQQIASAAAIEINYYLKDDNTKYTASSSEGITMDPYTILAGQMNPITVYYNGIKATLPIAVHGIADEALAISSVYYKDEKTVAGKLDVNKLHLVINMKSGNILDTDKNPELLTEISLSSTELKSGTNTIDVSFRGVSKACQIQVDNGAVPVENPDSKNPSDLGSVTPSTETPATKPENEKETENTSGVTIKKGTKFTVSNVVYQVVCYSGSTKTVKIVGCKNKSKSASVVNSVKYKNQKFKVVAIGNKAFMNCKKISGGVIIDGSITSIGDSAFKGCVNINGVWIGSNVKSIGKNAFYGCKKNKLVDFTLSKKMKKIGKGAFKKMNKNFMFNVPKKMKKRFTKMLRGTF